MRNKIMALSGALLCIAFCITVFLTMFGKKTPVEINRAEYMAQDAEPSAMSASYTENIYGDVDRNGVVDTYDALLVLKYSIGVDDTQIKAEYADVDANGVTDTNDALLILRYACGLVDRFPAESLTAKQSGNPQNGSIAVEYGPCIYYTDLKTGIFRTQSDGSEQKQLRSCSADSLSIMGGYIYYIDYARAASICRTDLAGENFSEIVQRPAACLSAADGWLYYIDTADGYSLRRTSENGEQTQTLAEGRCGMPKLYEGSIYYIKYADGRESGSIERLDISTGERISLGKNTDFFDVYDGYVYYINKDAKDRIYRMSLDGKTFATFCSYGAQRLNVYGDSIYFLRPDEDYAIYRLALDKSSIKRITRTPSDYINLAGDYLFFTNEQMAVCRTDLSGADMAVMTENR